MDNLGQPLLR